MRAEQLTDPVAGHAEGPVWITGTRWPDGLYWVDMLAGDVLHLAGAQVVRRHVGTVAAVIRPRVSGGLAYAVERGFALDDGPGTPLVTLPELWSDHTLRMNEGGCDPAGNFYCGSMSYAETPGAGEFYRLDPTGDARLVAAGFTVPNGLAWTADGTRAFHADSPTGRIDVLSWSAADGLTDRRPFVAVDGPDGLTVDAEGGIWVALWGAGQVHGYTPDGTLQAVIEVPAALTTACTFGGPDLEQLYITTSRHGLADPEPAAGAVFVATPGVPGLPVLPYAG